MLDTRDIDPWVDINLNEIEPALTEEEKSNVKDLIN